MKLPKRIDYKRIVDELIETIQFNQHINSTKIAIGGLKEHNLQYYLGRKKSNDLILKFLGQKLDKDLIKKVQSSEPLDTSIIVQAMKDDII